MGRVQGPSARLAAQLLRSDLVELCPLKFSLRLRKRAISESDLYPLSTTNNSGTLIISVLFTLSLHSYHKL